MISYDSLLQLEQAYKGNLGMMEMMEFYQKATPEQKKTLEALIKAGNQSGAWALIQTVTHTQLEKV